VKPSPAFLPDGSPLPGPQVLDQIAADTDTILLAFSCGKDSIAAWLTCRDRFARIVPFYMYLIPHLNFVEASLAYYEDFFGTPILRVPHPSLYRMLTGLVMQPLERIRVIEAAGLPTFDYDTLTDLIKKELGLDKHQFTASGVRAADSPTRRAAMTQYGPINWNRHYFYPVWDMLKADLIALLTDSRIALPVDYLWFGRSFDGIDYRFLEPIRHHAPQDYETIRQWFPLVEMELIRYQSPGV
jgi:hypothetical protein